MRQESFPFSAVCYLRLRPESFMWYVKLACFWLEELEARGQTGVLLVLSQFCLAIPVNKYVLRPLLVLVLLGLPRWMDPPNPAFESCDIGYFFRTPSASQYPFSRSRCFLERDVRTQSSSIAKVRAGGHPLLSPISTFTDFSDDFPFEFHRDSEGNRKESCSSSLTGW